MALRRPDPHFTSRSSPVTIGDLLDEQVRTRPDALALIDPRAPSRASATKDGTLTFAELQHAVATAATVWLTEYRLRRGDAVLVFVPMSADLCVALLGLFRIGAVALFLDPSAGKAHLEACCSRWAPRALLAIPKAHLLRLRSPALRQIPLKISVGGWVPFTRRWRIATPAATLASRLAADTTAQRESFQTVGPALAAAPRTACPNKTDQPLGGRQSCPSPIYVDNSKNAQGKVRPQGPTLQSGQSVACGHASDHVSLVEPADPALVTFTSGSTGVPKATVRTHAFLLAQYRALAPSLHLQPGDIDLATLPIFVLANLAAGVTTTLPEVDLRKPGAVDAARLFDQIERQQVTRITASPALFERLIEHGHQTHRTLSTLRHLHTGGAPVFPRLLEALSRLAPNAQVVAVYGSTEAEPIAHLERAAITVADLTAMAAGRGLLAGAPVPEIRLAILADEFGRPRKEESAESFRAAQLPAGTIGEIVVTGEHVLKGYLGGQGDQETKFRVAGEIWHRTGDSGSLDATGRLWLNGRCGAKIEDAHGRLYPFGVECVVLTTFSEIRRVAVVSHKNQRVLVVEAADKSSEFEANLAAAVAWAHIEKVVFVDRLPVDRRHNAKIDYPALQKLLANR